MKRLIFALSFLAFLLTGCNENSPSYNPSFENGVLPGKFSVSANQQVHFSQGNLRYQASTKTWSFADHQYDFIGDAPGNTTVDALRPTQAEWIDLFGWATSGYKGQQPYTTSSDLSKYGTGVNSTDDLTGTNYDWGVYNAISNGGNKSGLWRTLNRDEWEYILNKRAHAVDLRGQASVNSIDGYIILPDDWETPEGLVFKPDPCNMTTNVYSLSQWNDMEQAGALFLPFAGQRRLEVVGIIIRNPSIEGYYATGSMWADPLFKEFWYEQNHYVNISNDRNAFLNTDALSRGYSVRLAQDVTK